MKADRTTGVSRPLSLPCAGQGWGFELQRSQYANWYIWIDAHTSFEMDQTVTIFKSKDKMRLEEED